MGPEAVKVLLGFVKVGSEVVKVHLGLVIMDPGQLGCIFCLS